MDLTFQKGVLFIIWDWNAKVRSQEIPGVTGKFGFEVQNEAGQRLTEFCWENTLVIANILFQQHKRRLYRWTSLEGQNAIMAICYFYWSVSLLFTEVPIYTSFPMVKHLFFSTFNLFILDYFDSVLVFRGRYVTQAWPIRTSNFLGHNNYFQDGHRLTQFEIIFEYLLGLLRGRQSRFFPGILAFAYISLFSCWQPTIYTIIKYSWE